MKSYTNQQIIKGIKEKNGKIISWVYSNYFRTVSDWVISNRGTYQDAQDVFQDALILIYKKARYGRVVIEKNFSGYFFSICRSLWLHILKMSREKVSAEELDDNPFSFSDNSDQDHDMELLQLLTHKYLVKMNPVCRELLKLFYDADTKRESLRQLGFVSVEAMKQQKHRCKQALLKLLKKDPVFKKYFLD